MAPPIAGLTGVLLVGGASARFGRPKPVAQLWGRTLAEIGWDLLGEACDERIAVGKEKDGLDLPFPVLDDGSEVRMLMFRPGDFVGVTTLIECGPGKVLAGLCRRIDPELTGVALYDPATLSDAKGLLA